MSLTMTKRVEEEPQVKGPPGQKKQEEQIVNWNKALNFVRTTMQYSIEVNKDKVITKRASPARRKSDSQPNLVWK